MTTTNTTSRKPTHAVYHVRGEGKTAHWTPIGAAWLHDDKQGLNLSIDLIPVRGDGRLVIRIKADKSERADGRAGE